MQLDVLERIRGGLIVSCQALPEEFFMEATLRVAFKSQHECGCHCGDCDSCASGCGDEEAGVRTDGCGEEDHHHDHGDKD